MRHPFFCRPMTSTVKRKIKEHALIVRGVDVAASEADCIALEWPSLFFVRTLEAPGNGQVGKKRQLRLRHSSGQQARRLSGKAMQLAARVSKQRT